MEIDGRGLRIAVIHTRWNARVVDALRDGCVAELRRCGVSEEDIVVQDVPGAFELPFAVRHIMRTKHVHAVVAIGCLIKGETMHFEYIADAVSHSLMRCNETGGAPVIFGVLTVLTEAQALARAGLGGATTHNHGVDWAQASMQMARLAEE